MKIKYQAIIFVHFFLLAIQSDIKCQNGADEKLLERLTSELNLDSSQVVSLDSVYTQFALQLDSLNATIKTIQTGELSEDEVNKRTSVLFAERKDLRIWKETQTISYFSEEQKLKYKAYKAKSKPVLHFGHNKADCVTCVKPEVGLGR